LTHLSPVSGLFSWFDLLLGKKWGKIDWKIIEFIELFWKISKLNELNIGEKYRNVV
jgi:hypothetical protein